MAAFALTLSLPSVARAESPDWEKDKDDWGPEFQIGPVFGAGERVGLEHWSFLVGGVASVGFRRRLEFEKGSDGDVPLVLAVPTLGLAYLPPSAVYGTELGLDFRFEGLGMFGQHGVRWIAALEPVFRVSPRDSRARFPTLLQYVMPTVGVAFDEPGAGDSFRGMRTTLYVAPKLLPLDILLVEDFALELDSWIPLFIDPEHATVSMGVAFSTKVIVR